MPVLLTGEGLTANFQPSTMPLSVFGLVTAEYDIRNCPGQAADEIRRLAVDQRRLRRVRRELPQHVLELQTDASLVRVRTHEGKPDGPWPVQGMYGRPDYPEARANVLRQPIIYCADSLETAIAEARVEPGTYFTLAELQPLRTLKLINVMGMNDGNVDSPFMLINLWMSRPVNDRSRVLRPYPVENEQEHYYATQLFSTIVREEGYDGVQFSSTVHEGGANVALFDPECVVVRACELKTL